MLSTWRTHNMRTIWIKVEWIVQFFFFCYTFKFYVFPEIWTKQCDVIIYFLSYKTFFFASFVYLIHSRHLRLILFSLSTARQRNLYWFFYQRSIDIKILCQKNCKLDYCVECDWQSVRYLVWFGNISMHLRVYRVCLRLAMMYVHGIRGN